MNLKVEKRENKTKGELRQFRLAGKVPGVLYGKKQDPMPVLVTERDLDVIASSQAGLNTLLDISFGDGETTMALIRDYQAHPIHRRFTHVDLQAMDETQRIVTEVPIELKGRAIGLEQGGVLEQILRSIEVRCVVTAIPEKLEVDVSTMEIGDNIHIQDLKLPEGVELAKEMDYTVATLVPPTKEEEVAAPAEGAEGAVEGAAAPAEGAEGAAKPAKAEGGKEKEGEPKAKSKGKE
ncbi:MAG: 50S ribosomal protein L25/general stress protein Ctc [Pseudomonadota bacterium]